MRRPSESQALLLIAAFALLCLLSAPLLGNGIPPLDAIMHPRSGDPEASIFWNLRLPRALAGFLAGAALAVSGMAFQAVFRNPLTTESTLGVSSGAAFGAALQTRLGLAPAILGISTDCVFAFFGALLSVALVFGLSRFRKGLSPTGLLLAGVAVSAFFSSLVLAVQSVSDFFDSYKLLRWLMGGLASADYWTALALLLSAVPCVAVCAFNWRALDLLSAGEDIAASRGVEVRKIRLGLIIGASLTVGGAVSLCGPIGFVGLVAPHICRMLVGHGHRLLIPASLLMGGAMLALCDAAARVWTVPAELPAGAVTALIGAPFFVWLLLKMESPSEEP